MLWESQKSASKHEGRFLIIYSLKSKMKKKNKIIKKGGWWETQDKASGRGISLLEFVYSSMPCTRFFHVGLHFMAHIPEGPSWLLPPPPPPKPIGPSTSPMFGKQTKISSIQIFFVKLSLI